MKIVLISSSPKLYTSKKILTHLYARRIKVVILTENELKNDYEAQSNLKSSELIINRSLGLDYKNFDLKLLQSLDSNIEIINSVAITKKHRNKLSSYNELKLFYPKTLDFKDIAIKKISYDQIIQKLGSAHFFLKPNRGMMGKLIKIIKASNQWAQVYAKLISCQDYDFHLQQAISMKNEWRVYIINKKIQARFKKHINNTNINVFSESLGDFVQEHETIDKYVQKILEICNPFFCSMDIAEDNQGKFHLIDFNLTPGFETADKIGRLDLGKIFINEILCRL